MNPNDFDGDGRESLLALLVRERRMIVRAVVLSVLAGAAYMFLREDKYVAESQVRPQGQQNNANRLAGLAASIGFAVPLGAQDPVRLYAEMARSHVLLDTLLKMRFARPGESDSLPLIDLLKIRGSGSRRVNKGIDAMRARVEPLASLEVGTLRLRVTTPWPNVSELANRRVLVLLDALTLKSRQEQATAERTFMEARLATALGDLRKAEDTFAEFLKSNRRTDSPQLKADEGRLQRVVDLRQQLYVGLSQSYETARIDEVRNTPVLGVLDPPEGTAKNANHLRDGLIWLILGVMAGAAFVLIRRALELWAARNPTEWRQLASLRIGNLLTSGSSRGDAER